MKRFLLPKGTPVTTAATAKRTSDKLEQAENSAGKKAKLSGRQQPSSSSRNAGSLSTTLTHNGWTDLGQEARVGYWPRFLSGMSQRAMKTLLQDIPWQQRDLVIFGRTVAQPRLVAYMADPGLPPYSYSGLTLTSLPWSQLVLEIKAEVEKLQPGTSYNSCLLNLYKDGSHHVSWHADDEKLYGDTPTISSVSFGAARTFVMRQQQDHSKKMSITLSAGDVLIMDGTTQQHWQHAVPKRKGVEQPRVNLTFRRVMEAVQ